MIDEPITREYVIARLEEAGATLLAMHLGRVGPSERVTAAWPEMLRDEFIDLPDPNHRIRLLPGADKITRMDEAFGWVSLEPNARNRRVLMMRSMVDPVRSRHIWRWTRIGRAMHANWRAVKGWHAKAIATLVLALGGDASMSVFTVAERKKKISHILVSYFDSAA